VVLLGIDHLVVAVRDPDAAAAELERVVGLACTGGGRHASAGTFNRLAFLGDPYIELIGVFDAPMVERSAAFAVGLAALERLRSGRQGFATWAIATDDVAADVARLRDAGSTIGDPVAGSRVRPDGDVVRWITAFPELGPERPPFLIEHEHRGAEWGDAARAARAAFRHPAGGAVRMVGISLPVRDAGTAAAAFSRAVGLALGPAGRGWRGRVGPHAVELRPTATVRALPVVELAGEAGSPHLDVVRFGVRWRRRPVGSLEDDPDPVPAVLVDLEDRTALA
jgi:hypothetical protein